MNKRSKYKGSTERWSLDPDKSVSYEFEFKGQIVTPGMQIKFKNDHSTYTFQCLVSKLSNGEAWLEVLSPTGFHSKRINQISKIVGVKRSYAKKAAKV